LPLFRDNVVGYALLPVHLVQQISSAAQLVRLDQPFTLQRHFVGFQLVHTTYQREQLAFRLRIQTFREVLGERKWICEIKYSWIFLERRKRLLHFLRPLPVAGPRPVRSLFWTSAPRIFPVRVQCNSGPTTPGACLAGRCQRNLCLRNVYILLYYISVGIIIIYLNTFHNVYTTFMVRIL